MINALQVVESLGLFDVKVPGNVSTFMETFGKLSSFELFSTESWGTNNMYLPETAGFSLVFESAGFESIYIIVLLGTVFIATIIILTLIFIDILLKYLGRKWHKIASFREKTTSKWLYWNFLIRFFLEVYLNFVMFSLVNLTKSKWRTGLNAVNFSNIFSLFILLVSVVGPIVIVTQAIRNQEKWEEAAYQ